MHLSMYTRFHRETLEASEKMCKTLEHHFADARAVAARGNEDRLAQVSLCKRIITTLAYAYIHTQTHSHYRTSTHTYSCGTTQQDTRRQKCTRSKIIAEFGVPKGCFTDFMIFRQLWKSVTELEKQLLDQRYVYVIVQYFMIYRLPFCVDDFAFAFLSVL